RPPDGARAGDRVQSGPAARLRELRLQSVLRHQARAELQEPGLDFRAHARKHAVRGAQGHSGLSIRAVGGCGCRDVGNLQTLDDGSSADSFFAKRSRLNGVRATCRTFRLSKRTWLA